MKRLSTLLSAIAALLLLTCSGPAALAQSTNRIKVSELPTTNVLAGSNLIMVVVFPFPHPNSTNGAGGNYSISVSNLLESLKAQPNWTGGGGGGGEPSNGDKGEITVSGGVWSVNPLVITDAKIAVSGITTRSKLPSPLAYEDEANTFSLLNTFNGIVDTRSVFTNTTLAVLNGVLVNGSLNVQGAANSYAQDVTFNGPVYLSTLATNKILTLGGNGAVTVGPSVTDVITNIDEGAKIFVRTNGNDSTGARGRLDKAFRTLIGARNASKPGDTIDVGPGVYNERRWATNGVNWWFQSGSVVTNHDTNGNLGGWGLIDDRGIGAITSTIAGNGTFLMAMSDVSTNPGGLMMITNPLSRVTLKAKTLIVSYAGGSENTGFSAINSKDGTNTVIVDEIIDPFYEGIPFEEEPGVTNITVSGADGIYWERGDLYVKANRIRVGGYAYYGSEPSTGATNNFWMEVDEASSYWASTLYQVGLNTSTGYRAWIRAKEIRREGISAAGFSAISLYGGKFYLEAEKIGITNDLPLILSPTGVGNQETWITAQKLSAPKRWVDHQSGTLHLSAQQYEDTGAVDYGVRVRGGVLNMIGGRVAVRNGHAVEHLSGTNRLVGVVIDTTGTNASHATATNNRPVTVAAAGVSIHASALISPTNGASSVFASNAQSVSVSGALARNVEPNDNVTVTGLTNSIPYPQVPTLPTNSIPYIGAGGILSAAALSGLTLSGGTLTASAGAGDAGGTNARQWGSAVLSNIVGMASQYWTNAQASAMLLSNLVNNPYTGYTNKAVQIAANNVLSNLQTMASFYWTNAQASSMVLSNLVNNPYTGYTNPAVQIAANNVLSNLQTMASFYWTNSQASSMVLSNLVGTVGNNVTNIAQGWGIHSLVSSGTLTTTATNRQASISTNATGTTVDFSDAANINIYNAWFHLTTNLVISPTNLVVGRTLCIRFDTNALSHDVAVTNTAANPVNYNLNVTTNGSTAFRKTNSVRARLYLTCETNGVISADFGYYR